MDLNNKNNYNYHNFRGFYGSVYFNIVIFCDVAFTLNVVPASGTAVLLSTDHVRQQQGMEKTELVLHHSMK